MTVPAIRNDDAKYTMKKWTIEGKLIEKDVGDRCIIVYGALLAIQYEIARTRQKQLQENNKRQNDTNGITLENTETNV